MKIVDIVNPTYFNPLSDYPITKVATDFLDYYDLSLKWTPPEWSQETQERYIGRLLEDSKAASIHPIVVNWKKAGIYTLVDGSERITAMLLWSNRQIKALLSDGSRVGIDDIEDRMVLDSAVKFQVGFVSLSEDEAHDLRIHLNSW